MKILRNKTYKYLTNKLNILQKKFDVFVDPYTSKGSTTDRINRSYGSGVIMDDSTALSKFISNGFIQNIIKKPAFDAVREWIDVSTNMDTEDEEVNYSKMIMDRLDELDFRQKIFDLIFYSRLYSRGSVMYFAVKANQVQEGYILEQPIPEKIKSIEFINVIDRPGLFSIRNTNNSMPLLKNYNQFEISINGQVVHPSRYVWMVNNFISQKQSGISEVQTINDAIIAQDNGLWSVATMLDSLSVNIFKSDEVANLSPTDKAELLAKIKHMMITFSTFALKQDENFEMRPLQVQGLKEIFDFVFDNLGGLAEIPRKILLGNAHGIVTGAEFDTLNYYNNIAQWQEVKIRPIIEKVIDLVVKEQNGEIYKALNGNTEELEVNFKFKSLWKLDPVSQAENDLKNAQRDQIDITMGKTGPEEARQLDPRYANLESFVMDRQIPPNLKEPDNELEVPEDKKTSG